MPPLEVGRNTAVIDLDRAMGIDRIAGILLIIGSVVAGGWAVARGSIDDDTPFVVAAGSLVASGAAILAARGPAALASPPTRTGLALVAGGLLVLIVGRTVVTIPAGQNELQSWPYLLLVFGGILVTVVGLVVAGLSLARSAGGSRLVGLVLLAGVPVAGLLNPSSISWLGFVPGLLGIAGVGALALGRQAAPAA
jgi:hypothetical protein